MYYLIKFKFQQGFIIVVKYIILLRPQGKEPSVYK